MRNAKQEFPCESLESFSGEYYNKENKTLDFQSGPMCANQIRSNCSVGSKQDEAEIQYDDGVHQNGAIGKNVKNINQLRMRASRNSGS